MVGSITENTEALMQSLSDLFADEDDTLDDVFGASVSVLSAVGAVRKVNDDMCRNKEALLDNKKWHGSCESFICYGDDLLNFSKSGSDFYTSDHDFLSQPNLTKRGQMNSAIKPSSRRSLKEVEIMRRKPENYADQNLSFVQGGRNNAEQRQNINQVHRTNIDNATNRHVHLPALSSSNKVDIRTPCDMKAKTTNPRVISNTTNASHGYSCQDVTPRQPSRSSVNQMIRRFENHHKDPEVTTFSIASISQVGKTEKIAESPAKIKTPSSHSPRRPIRQKSMRNGLGDGPSTRVTSDVSLDETAHEEVVVVAPSPSRALVSMDACPLVTGFDDRMLRMHRRSKSTPPPSLSPQQDAAPKRPSRARSPPTSARHHAAEGAASRAKVHRGRSPADYARSQSLRAVTTSPPIAQTMVATVAVRERSKSRHRLQAKSGSNRKMDESVPSLTTRDKSERRLKDSKSNSKRKLKESTSKPYQSSGKLNESSGNLKNDLSGKQNESLGKVLTSGSSMCFQGQADDSSVSKSKSSRRLKLGTDGAEPKLRSKSRSRRSEAEASGAEPKVSSINRSPSVHRRSVRTLSTIPGAKDKNYDNFKQKSYVMKKVAAVTNIDTGPHQRSPSEESKSMADSYVSSNGLRTANRASISCKDIARMKENKDNANFSTPRKNPGVLKTSASCKHFAKEIALPSLTDFPTDKTPNKTQKHEITPLSVRRGQKTTIPLAIEFHLESREKREVKNNNSAGVPYVSPRKSPRSIAASDSRRHLKTEQYKNDSSPISPIRSRRNLHTSVSCQRFSSIESNDISLPSITDFHAAARGENEGCKGTTDVPPLSLRKCPQPFRPSASCRELNFKPEKDSMDVAPISPRRLLHYDFQTSPSRDKFDSTGAKEITLPSLTDFHDVVSLMGHDTKKDGTATMPRQAMAVALKSSASCRELNFKSDQDYNKDQAPVSPRRRMRSKCNKAAALKERFNASLPSNLDYFFSHKLPAPAPAVIEAIR